MPILNVIPANEPLDENDLDDEDVAGRTNRLQAYSLSPSPSPVPADEIDPEFDPDNVVIRGSYTDDDDDGDDGDDHNGIRNN